MKLSLCLATYNEEKNIHYPLDSAYDLADEVVIVDGGSSDRTVEIAKSYDKSAKGRSPSGRKIRVFIEENPSMFHINKQKAIERAKGEWILQLDADEALSEELKEEIRQIVILSGAKNPRLPDGQVSRMREEGNTSEVLHAKSSSFTSEVKDVAYYLPRKNFFLSRFLSKGGQYPNYTIRLYKNGVARFPCKSVHENVEIVKTSEVEEERSDGKTSEVKAKIGYLNNPILHFADPDFSRYLKRWDRYTTADAEILVRDGRDHSLHFFDYFFLKPTSWFINTYFRHKGYVDGFPGFVFALFSSIRFWVIYVKWWSLRTGSKIHSSSV